MHSFLLVDQEKCRACRTCEVVCSFFKCGKFNPALSRIHAIRWESEPLVGKHLTLVCQQCNPPKCISVCPLKAMFLDENTGAIIIDNSLCNGCGICIRECNFRLIRRDPEKGTPLICDLCNGKPKCAEWCPAEAIYYIPATWNNLIKKKKSSMILLSKVRKTTKQIGGD